jgi:hypothetical protein
MVRSIAAALGYAQIGKYAIDHQGIPDPAYDAVAAI